MTATSATMVFWEMLQTALAFFCKESYPLTAQQRWHQISGPIETVAKTIDERRCDGKSEETGANQSWL